jgi:hypothetical protein
MMQTLRSLTPIDHKIERECHAVAKAQKEARRALVSNLWFARSAPTPKAWRLYLQFLDQGLEYWSSRPAR